MNPTEALNPFPLGDYLAAALEDRPTPDVVFGERVAEEQGPLSSDDVLRALHYFDNRHTDYVFKFLVEDDEFRGRYIDSLGIVHAAYILGPSAVADMTPGNHDELRKKTIAQPSTGGERDRIEDLVGVTHALGARGDFASQSVAQSAQNSIYPMLIDKYLHEASPLDFLIAGVQKPMTILVDEAGRRLEEHGPEALSKAFDLLPKLPPTAEQAAARFVTDRSRRYMQGVIIPPDSERRLRAPAPHDFAHDFPMLMDSGSAELVAGLSEDEISLALGKLSGIIK